MNEPRHIALLHSAGFVRMIRAIVLCGLLAGLSAPLSAEPILAIAGTMDATEDYDVVLDALADVQADATSLTLFWDLMEKDGTYAPDPDWPTIANIVYPSQNLQVSLMISVIDTVTDRRPADLQQRAFSDPVVIARFETFLTEVLTAMPDVQLTSIGIGNEVDGYLDDTNYDDFAVFFAAASDAAHRLAPGVPVGMTLTWDGLAADLRAQALAELGDVWMVNYYPLTPEFQVKDPRGTADVLTDMVTLAGRKPVMLMETGYPSGGCGASEAAQLDHTQRVLQYAQAHADAMPLVTFVWLHDLPTAAVAGYADYYGVSDPCFADYLATLGLRTWDGRDKAAFTWLRER